MASSHIIRLQSITGNGGVLIALQHNKRTLQAARGASAHIEVNRTPLNYCLAGDDAPQAIATHAKVRMVQAGIDKPRKNQVMAIEVLFSLPIGRHQQDTRPFFNDCLQWVQQHIAGELLAFDVHLDESAPHAHAVILPLVNGKMQGSSIMGGKGNLLRLINQFYADVAKHHGLSKAVSKRISATGKAALAKQICARLKADPVMKSIIWPWVRDAVHLDPFPCAQILGLDNTQKAPANKIKSFVDYRRAKGKGSFVA